MLILNLVKRHFPKKLMLFGGLTVPRITNTHVFYHYQHLKQKQTKGTIIKERKSKRNKRRYRGTACVLHLFCIYPLFFNFFWLNIKCFMQPNWHQCHAVQYNLRTILELTRVEAFCMEIEDNFCWRDCMYVSYEVFCWGVDGRLTCDAIFSLLQQNQQNRKLVTFAGKGRFVWCLHAWGWFFNGNTFYRNISFGFKYVMLFVTCD